MLPWAEILDANLLQTVLPSKYARFAPAVRDGLVVFLSGLPRARQQEILTRQAELPPSAEISERLAVLAHACPVLHKLGQVLARDDRLALKLRRQLQKLESLPPSVSAEFIERSLTAELGPLAPQGIRLAFPALAEASVAVVVPYATAERPAAADSVFKILKPDIEATLDEELVLLEKVGAHLDQRCDELDLPHLRYAEVFQQIREKLAQEVLLNEEQRHLSQSSQFYWNEPRIHIPALRPHCTPRVTAMERIYGVKVTDHRLVRRVERRQIAELISRALIAGPIFSPAPLALFHADPHAGNLFFTDSQRLAILDWSLVGRLGDPPRVGLARIMQSALAFDGTSLAASLESLAANGRCDQAAVRRVAQQRIGQVRQGVLPGFSWLLGLIDEVVQTAKMQVESELMLFRKSLHTLEGVIREVAPRVTMDELLFREFFRHFVAEWPWRWLQPFTSRESATRISNWDLCAAGLSLPLTAARYWQGRWQDYNNGREEN